MTILTIEQQLKNANADYEIFNDSLSLEKATQGASHYGISLQEAAPTLILKANDKYYAAIIRGDTRISFKKLKQALNVKDIKMADPAAVVELTGAKVGEVSLINNITTLIDEKVLINKYCYGGCGVSNATLKISTDDLVRITQAQVFDFTDPR